MNKLKQSFLVAEARLGALAILPLVISVAAYGLLWGTLAAEKGLSVLETFLMSAIVFAGGSQFVVLDIWSTPVAIWTLGATAFLVNLRHILMGASFAPYIRPWSTKGIYAALFFMTDENWALAMRRARAGKLSIGYYFGMAALLYPTWVLATPLGNLIGAGLTDVKTWGLDFAFSAVFLVLITGFWVSPRKSIPPWAASAAAALVTFHLAPGAWYILAGGLAGTFVGYLQGPSGLKREAQA